MIGAAPLLLLLAAWAPGEILVRVANPAEAERVRREHRLELAEPRSVLGWERVRVDGADLDLVLKRLAADPRVLAAERNALVRPRELANDYLFGEQWALHNLGQGQGGGWPPDVDVNAPEAWDLTTGSPDVVVAITDTGVWLGHEDLAANAWKNVDEIAGNGVDDDGNGYVDDRNGWDFVDDDTSPSDPAGHGTHVAGIVGARGDNGIGISGVAWTVQLMALRMIGDGGDAEGSAFDAAESIVYAVDNGAQVINASWGFDEHYSAAIEDAVAYAAERGVLIVIAAGNSNKDLDRAGVEDWPTELDYDNVITVGAVARDAWLTDFSSYGRNAVDIGAPGGPIILSSWITQGGWGYYRHEIGTSMAAPHVAGIAALLLSVDPSLKASDLRRILLSTARPVPDPDATVAGGRADAYAALRAARGADLPPVARVPNAFGAHVGDRVRLSGAQSMDPNGAPLSHQWVLYKPTASAAALSDPTAAEPTFDADVCGYYEGVLQVSDGTSTSEIARVPVFVGFEEPADVETPHPYWSSYEEEWTVSKPGASAIAVRFDTLDTRGGLDAASIWQGNTLVELYSGKASGFVSKPVFGETLRLSFYAPSQQARYGFVVDRVWWCDGRCDQPGFGDCDGDPANGCEQDLSVSAEHCGACNVPCSDPGGDDDDDEDGGPGVGGAGGGGACGCDLATPARRGVLTPGALLATWAVFAVRRRRIA